MLKPLRYLPVVVLGMSMLAAPACAYSQPRYRYPSPVRVDTRAYDRGFQEGRRAGEDDGRRNRRFDYARHNEYEDADAGYRGGNRSDYRRAFRQGFVDGYNEGYRRYARGGYDDPPSFPQRNPYPSTRYPDYPVYGGRGSVYASPAANSGYRDGYDQGRDDARHGRRFDVLQSKRYRSGDHDYDRRYGSREDYQRDYRAAFQRGYEDGYRAG